MKIELNRKKGELYSILSFKREINHEKFLYEIQKLFTDFCESNNSYNAKLTLEVNFLDKDIY